MLRPLAIVSLIGCLLAPPAAAAEEWTSHKATKCGSSALFPSAPTESVDRFASVDGDVTATLYIAKPAGDQVVFLVGCNDYAKPKTKGKAFLDAARDVAVANVRGTLLSEKKVTVGGFAGRELEIEAPGDNRVFVRLVAVKTRLHQALIVTPRGQVQAADVKRFLGSLKLPRKK